MRDHHHSTSITITRATAETLYNDPLPHSAEYQPPSAGVGVLDQGYLVIDEVHYYIVLPDPPRPRKRLRAGLMPWRYWR